MVCLGEGLMPKAGETPEMGANPLLGFGRIYARPEVARWLEARVIQLLNEADYGWNRFYGDLKESGITVWGAAIDTLENTSRFAKGEDTGPMTVLHLFDQPLRITRPYEGYVGNLLLPRKVVEKAAERSILINFRTPRSLVVEAIEMTYPGIRRENIHVWTLRGPSRELRIGALWADWERLGAHLVDDGWTLPTGAEAFTDSGTYAPTFLIGTWQDDAGAFHLFLVDGYAASAEALQAASLAPMFDVKAYLAIFTSTFTLPYSQEQHVMSLDPNATDFCSRLEQLCDGPLDNVAVDRYRGMIKEARDASVPVAKPSIQADDFFPEKDWDVMAICGYMRPDPYTGTAGVEEVRPGVYRVTVRQATSRGEKEITFALRLMETLEQSRLVFNPLLNRFLSGEDYESRPVKISDSGRIRNELQTLCSEALEFHKGQGIMVHFDRIPAEVIPAKSQQKLSQILHWYKENHPLWFAWLRIEE
jgi:hypothetical protein